MLPIRPQSTSISTPNVYQPEGQQQIQNLSTTSSIDSSFIETKQSTYTPVSTIITQQPSKHTSKKHYIEDNYPKAKFPAYTCTLPKEINTTQHRKDYLLLKYHIASSQDRTASTEALRSVLNSTCLDRLTKNNATRPKYLTRRLLCIQPKKHTRPITAEEKRLVWHKMFTSHQNDILADRTKHEQYGAMQKRKNELLKQLSTEFQTLLLQLEIFSISLEDYCRLRERVYQTGARTNHTEKLARMSMFPGIIIANKQKESNRTKATHPAYKWAAQAYFKIVHHMHRSSKVLTDSQRHIKEKMQSHLYTSITELEQDTSIIANSMCYNSLKKILHCALYKMEQEGILPMDISEINDPFIQEKKASDYAQQATLSKTTTQSKIETKQQTVSEEVPETQLSITAMQTSAPNTYAFTSSDWTQQQSQQDMPEEVRTAAMALLLLRSSSQ